MIEQYDGNDKITQIQFSGNDLRINESIEEPQLLLDYSGIP